jgi:phage I-like protein
MRERAQALYSKHGSDALSAFLEALPVSAVASVAVISGQPAPTQGAVPESTTEHVALAKALGCTPKKLLKAESEWAENKGIIDDAHLSELEDARKDKRRASDASAA